MALPYPSMSYTPFDILTAEEMNQMAENDQALAAGTGLNDGAVTPAKIDWTTPDSRYHAVEHTFTGTGSVTINPASFKPTKITAFPYSTYSDDNVASSQGVALLTDDNSIVQWGVAGNSTGTIRGLSLILSRRNVSGTEGTRGEVTAFVEGGCTINIVEYWPATPAWILVFER